MRTLRKTLNVNRRQFLQQSAGAAVLVGAVSGGGAFAATWNTLEQDSGAALTKMARDLYPHDRVPDAYYENAVAAIDTALAKDAATSRLLINGAASLNAAATSAHGKPYAELQSEADRIALLKGMESTPFFVTVRGQMITAFYNQPEVWAMLGYEGSSAEHGGYLHRGFNDIDWLPV
jgi:hypothetical protein